MRAGKFCTLFSLLLVSTSITYGQEVFTLNKAIDYAREHAIGLKNAKLEEDVAQAKVKETIGIGLPQIDGSVVLNHNEQLPRFFASKRAIFGFSGLDESEYGNFFPGASDNDIIAGQNFFQLKNSGDAGISVNQLLFNGSYLVGLKAASAYKDLAVKQADQTEEQLIENVKKAYYGAQINQERIKLYESNIARVDSLLRNTRAMFNAGFAEEIDVSRIQVSLNNLITERDKFQNLQRLSLDLLKFQMNYPMDQEIQVIGELSAIALPENLDHYYTNWDYARRSDYRLLDANRTLQELNVRNKYAAGMPILSAYANAGYSTQSPTIGGIFKTETNISDAGGAGPDKWYPYSSFGLRLSIPIFSGLQRTYAAQQEKIKLLEINNSFEMLKSGIDLEIKQAVTDYQNSLKSLEAQKENMGLADHVAHVTKVKYEQGVGSNLEVVTAETDLKTAQVNYYNALYDAMVAKVELEKAFGLLNQNDNANNQK